MEEKFLYILGAGASATPNALPTVKGIKDKANEKYIVLSMEAAFLEMIDFISGYVDKYPNNANRLKEFAEDLRWLANVTNGYTTPDTFAKFCFLKNDMSALKRLKKTLAAYFIIEQNCRDKRDQRYLTFFINILSNNSFPANIKILNWNYDYQVQIAANRFQTQFNPFDNSLSQPILQFYPPAGNYSDQSNVTIDHEKISLVHLNGIAGLIHSGHNVDSVFDFGNLPKPGFQLIDDVLSFSESYSKTLSFAWEDCLNNHELE